MHQLAQIAWCSCWISLIAGFDNKPSFFLFQWCYQHKTNPLICLRQQLKLSEQVLISFQQNFTLTLTLSHTRTRTRGRVLQAISVSLCQKSDKWFKGVLPSVDVPPHLMLIVALKKMAVCCQNLLLRVLGSHNALSVPVGEVFTIFSFLLTPLIYIWQQLWSWTLSILK